MKKYDALCGYGDNGGLGGGLETILRAYYDLAVSRGGDVNEWGVENIVAPNDEEMISTHIADKFRAKGVRASLHAVAEPCEVVWLGDGGELGWMIETDWLKVDSEVRKEGCSMTNTLVEWWDKTFPLSPIGVLTRLSLFITPRETALRGHLYSGILTLMSAAMPVAYRPYTTLLPCAVELNELTKIGDPRRKGLQVKAAVVMLADEWFGGLHVPYGVERTN